MNVRALATIETVADLAPIPDADAIERAQIRGWDVVVPRDQFTVGETVVYFEIDSFLDVTDPRFAFLAKHGTKTDHKGRTGHRLRTAKLRGQPSQGLIMPLADFPEIAPGATPGADVTDVLGIVKWDPPLPAELDGIARGGLPGWVDRTDQERVQNLVAILATGNQAAWLATEKVDGTSVTFYRDPTTEHVYGACSRNRDLRRSPGSAQYQVAYELDIWALLDFIAGVNDADRSRVAIQGELFGPGIQGNPLRVKDLQFGAFGLIVDGVPVVRDDWPDLDLEDLAIPAHRHLDFPSTVEQALADVDRLDSLIAPGRPAEGVVWTATDQSSVTLPDGSSRKASFKVVSNRYLLKTGG